MGAFWQDRFLSTKVDTRKYLLRCIVYVDLNMVRCRVVKHPRKWAWSGYHEIAGNRKRYCLIDKEKLLLLTGSQSIEKLAKYIESEIERKIAAGELSREPCWTECIAVGSEEFVKEAEQAVEGRVKLKIGPDEKYEGMWFLKEQPSPYRTL